MHTTGVTYPLEMHIVHVVSQQDWPACPAGGCLLVLGMVFHLEDDTSKAIPALDTILEYAPINEDVSASVAWSFCMFFAPWHWC